ncbi:hypothetical protein [Geothrix sp. PMB-07]|uniref:hypothetical protein n=1 Tax=Geothrix sp. PMB-07 TaxID=3068640 RepID=UPI002741B735|nr:hypothetical protein [Geothrix sp. PMB-07]WLT32652.1 hypothetical protein Q9293_04805 [Geothrix sp. PMB-07]
MNLKLEAINLVRWLHFVVLAVGGGATVVTLLLSGFEEGREDLRGLAATVWSKVVAWSFRLALIAGIALLVLSLQAGSNPLKDGHYFHIKLLLVLVLVGLSEMTPKALAAGKRGSALIVLVLFLATSFTVFNKGLFGTRAKTSVDVPVTATVSAQPR